MLFFDVYFSIEHENSFVCIGPSIVYHKNAAKSELSLKYSYLFVHVLYVSYYPF